MLKVDLWIKRDDFTGMNLFGGNKIRKLEYLLGDALASGCDTVFTYGATQSNHAMQTVAACRRLGLNPILYLNTYVKPDPNDVRSNMLLDRVFGAEMHILESRPGESEADTEERCFDLGKAHAARLESQGHGCCDIPLGGASPIGSAGFIGGALELTRQCTDGGVDPSFIFCATGTGGTLAGLTAGYRALGSKARIIGVAVSDKNSEYETKCSNLANASLAWLGSDVKLDASDFTVERGYFQPGYEKPNFAATEAIRLLARTEGLIADPVYTGKAFAGMLGWIRSGGAPMGSTLVFWHTGGATALFAESAIVGDLSSEI
jgi:D-cysteine desulfhydrase family pyridoxal phosphate-dependent enzyme